MTGRAKSIGYDASRRRRRRWKFGAASFDEGSWTLLVDGRAVPLEVKPAELLHELLLHAGEVVAKDDLLDAIWPGVHVVESSLTVAVSKLRRALGDADAQMIETVPRIGYRLSAAVTVETTDAPLPPRFAFAVGDGVPGRPQWRLLEPLGASGANDVWRARHDKTGETRVFKFADTPDRLRSLKREAAIARLLAASLGPEGPFIPLLEWNFEAAPYFLESRDGGESLPEWAEARGGLAAVPPARRLAVGRAIVRALAQVHGAGILHKDLKPANILIEERGSHNGPTAFRIRLADFGSGAVLDEAMFARHAITGLPLADLDAAGSGGTWAYGAPELAEGAMPTMKADIYAMGLILFQLAAGDFRLGLSPGWEQQVKDPLLRQDIAEAAAGDPAQRLASADILSDRLDRLEERHAAAAVEAESARHLAALQQAETQRLARRPWVRAAAAAAIGGLLLTSVAAVMALRERDVARAQRNIAESSYSFLADDLMARADPAVANAAEEPIGPALRRAAAAIDTRFAGAPLVAGRLHQALARALAGRADYDGARAAFAAAAAAYARAGDAAKTEAGVAGFQHVLMEAGAASEGSLARAETAMADARKRWGDPAKLDGSLGFWATTAAGDLALAQDHVPDALAAYRRGAELAQSGAAGLSPRDSLLARQRVVRALLRADRSDDALALAKPLVQDEARLLGEDHADTLQARTFVAQALMQQYRNEPAVAALTDLLARVERVYGPAHPRTLQILGSRMESFKNMERYPEARADGERLWKTATESLGRGSFYAVGSRLDLARVLCRAGDTGAGLDHAKAAWRASVTAFGPHAPLTDGVRHGVADCLLASGRPADALPWLQGIDRKAVGELVGNAEWGLHVELLEAEIAARTGHPDEARRHFAAAKPAFDELLTDGYEVRRIARIEAAMGGAANG